MSIIRLFNEDCLPAMKLMPDKCYDLAIVDPEYGINRGKKFGGTNWKIYDKKEWDSKPANNEYFTELFRVSKNQIIWGGNYFTQSLPSSMGWIFWDKGQDLAMSDGELAYTSFDRALRRVIVNRCFIGEFGGLLHPTQKPVKLYKWLLTNYAKQGDKILDTHFGSLSIGIACHDLGFDLDAYEIDKDYFEAGKKRLETHQKQIRIDFDKTENIELNDNKLF